MSDDVKLYGCYSQTQTDMARRCKPAQPSIFEYLRPGGKMTVHCTAVSTTPGCPEYVFADKTEAVEVIKFIRIVK